MKASPLGRQHDEATTTGIPVLVVSADPHLLEQVQDQAARFGTLRNFSKPCNLPKLLETMTMMAGDD